MIAGPGVIADRLDVGQQQFRRLAVDRELPQPLRAVGLDADHRDVRAVRRHRRRVLTLGRVRHARDRGRGDVVAIDVGLRAAAHRREQDGAAVGGERRLIVVARAIRDVHRTADRRGRGARERGEKDLGVRRRRRLKAGGDEREQKHASHGHGLY